MSKPEENKSLYSVRRSQSNLPLSSNLRHAAYYKEVLINNDTGVTLYFLTAGDTALKSVPTLTQHAFTRTLTIKEIVREVIVDKHGFTKDVSDPRDRVLSEYSIKLDDLMDHPVFVREFGVVIWRMNDVEVMRKYHPLAIDNYNKYVEDAIKTSLNECVSNPMRFLINIHKPERGKKKDSNWKHRTMFVIVNGRVLACKVSNIPSIEEGMWFTARIADFDNSESLVTYSVTGDNFQNLINEVEGDVTRIKFGDDEWIVGFRRKEIYKCCKEMRDRERSGLTQAEIDDKISSMTQDQLNKIEKLKKDLDLAKDDIVQKQSRIKLLEEKLSQEDAKVNLELAQLKSKTEREKIITERDRQVLDRENEYLKMQMMRFKLDAERETDRRNSELEKLKIDIERERREYEDRKRQEERRLEQERRDYERQVERDRREYERRKQEDERRLAEIKIETERLKASVEQDKRSVEMYKLDLDRQRYQSENAKRYSDTLTEQARQVPNLLSALLTIGRSVFATSSTVKTASKATGFFKDIIF